LETTSSPILNINALQQVAFVVYDLKKAMERLWTTFGIGPWKVNIRDCNSTGDKTMVTDLFYKNKPGRFSYQVAETLIGPNNLNYELVQPLFGENIYTDLLKQHGEGMHHLGWHIVHSQDDFLKVTETLEQNGFPCMQSARISGARVACFDTRKVLNAILEVSFRDPNAKRLDPCYIYPTPE
jgi:methylmalonyl-CoA/ethylmalonyl-CoA epimerase